MKSLQTVCLLLAGASLAAAQQYTITTVAGIPQTPGLYPGPNTVSLVPGVPVALPAPAPAIGPTGGQLYHPSVVYVDSNSNIYIANSYTYVVNMVSAKTGQILLIAGTGAKGTGGDDGSATIANLTDIHGIAVDSSGNIYISDTSSCRIRRIDNPATNATPFIATFAGNSSTSGGSNTSLFCGPQSGSPFVTPGALAFDSKGNLYVADYSASVIRMVTSAGVVSTFAGNGTYGNSGDGGPASKASLAYPASMVFDTAGNLYVGDLGNSNVRKIDTTGNISTVATGISPQGLAIDAAGNFYFVDGVSSTVRKLLPGGGIVDIAGNGQAGYGGDGSFSGTTYAGGQASLAQLNLPTALAMGPDGSIYVADTQNDIIRHLVAVPTSIGVQDAASELSGSNLQAGSISAGEILTLFGSGLGPSTLTQFTLGASGLFPTQLAGTSVTFNGVSAPLIYTSSGLVAAIAPLEINGSASATCVFANTAPTAVPCANIVLSYQAPGSKAITQFTASVPIANSTPALFTANESGSGQAAALNQNSSVNSAANPAKPGSTIVLYATGAGPVSGAVDGQPTPASCGTTCSAQLPVTVKIGSQCVYPTYAGAAPTLVAGVMQVNAPIPANIIPGAVLVQVLVGGNCSNLGGYPSQPGVTIAVSQ